MSPLGTLNAVGGLQAARSMWLDWESATLWPSTDLRSTESPIRDECNAVFEQVDMRNYDPLMSVTIVATARCSSTLFRRANVSLD